MRIGARIALTCVVALAGCAQEPLAPTAPVPAYTRSSIANSSQEMDDFAFDAGRAAATGSVCGTIDYPRISRFWREMYDYIDSVDGESRAAAAALFTFETGYSFGVKAIKLSGMPGEAECKSAAATFSDLEGVLR
jgi:hypothetical protein